MHSSSLNNQRNIVKPLISRLVKWPYATFSCICTEHGWLLPEPWSVEIALTSLLIRLFNMLCAVFKWKFSHDLLSASAISSHAFTTSVHFATYKSTAAEIAAALASGWLDCAIFVLYGLRSKYLTCLQHIQNTVTRIILQQQSLTSRDTL